jgi:Amino acid transporters
MIEMLRNQGLKRVRMRLFTAVIVVFTLTCSGSFGMEDVVSSSGPGLTLLMIIFLPILWSVPMAFVASELGSMVPEAGGLYRWIRRALGEYWSFQAGWWWTLSLYVDSAVYVALALDYIGAQYSWMGHDVIVILGWHLTWRLVVGAAIVVVFTFINMRGLELTGWSLTVIQVVVMVPLLTFTVIGIIKGSGNPFSPVLPAGETLLSSLKLGLAIMMWMYAGWESMSTLAGEIENPQRIIPKALLIGTPLVIITYFVTVFVAIRVARMTGVDAWQNMYTGGGGIDFVSACKIVLGGSAGVFLSYTMLVSAIFSNIGLYAGYLATGARPAFQMSRDRLLPRFWGKTHASWGTPWVSILIMGLVDVVLITHSFSALITIDVFLLMFAYILIFISVIVMRVKEPNTPRSFRVPLPTWALTIWVAIPIAIAVLALFTNGWDYLIGGLVGILTGPIGYLVFKSIYKGTSDRALEGATVTPEGELTQFGAAVEGVQ